MRNLLSDRAATILVEDRQFVPYDLALNGVSFDATSEVIHWTVEAVLYIDLQIHGTTVYQGPARIARIEDRYGQRRVGMQLLAGFLDIREMQRLDEENTLTRELEGGPEAVLASVAPQYLQVLTKAVHFLAYYRRSLGYHEARLGGTPEVKAALAELAKQDVPDEVAAAYQGRRLRFGPDYIIPKPVDTRVLTWVAPAVAGSAVQSWRGAKNTGWARFRCTHCARTSTTGLPRRTRCTARSA